MEFPLFERLNREVNPKKDLTKPQKKDLSKKISKLPDHEIIYALIKQYYIENESSDCLELPYKGSFSDNGGISYDLENLPIKLKHMLNKFIEIHEKSKN